MSANRSGIAMGLGWVWRFAVGVVKCTCCDVKTVTPAFADKYRQTRDKSWILLHVKAVLVLFWCCIGAKNAQKRNVFEACFRNKSRILASNAIVFHCRVQGVEWAGIGARALLVRRGIYSLLDFVSFINESVAICEGRRYCEPRDEE